MNAHSEALLAKVNPVLAERIQAIASNLAAQGITIIVSQGLRTNEEQDALWQQGRNPDGSYIDPIHRKGVVTNAKGGQSWHCFGLAVDCDVLNKDGSVDWNSSHPQWKAMEAAGVKLGLVSGANWVRIVDAPHFQLTGRFPEAAPDTEVRELAKNGLDALWNEIVPIVEVPEVENA